MDRIIIDGVEYRRFDHLYSVSADGRFLRNLQPYEPWRLASGYKAVGRRGLAHRIVAECWCPKPEGATDIHHINHDRGDNRSVNLVWLTKAEHMAQHPETGRQPMPDSGKAKLRAYRLGMTTSEATKAKQREAILRLGIKPPPRPIGTKMGDAFSARMSEVSKNRQSCTINGVSYRSFNEAGKALGMKPHTLRKRCLSDSFPDYRLGKKSI